MQAMQLWLLAMLALGLGATPSWAVQQTPASPPSNDKTVQTPRHKTAKPARGKSGKTFSQHAAKPTQGSDLGAGKRDPFKLPELGTGKGGGIMDSAAGGVLPPGVRGLLISQLRLEGVVRQETANKMIAVVTNDTRRAYFLTVNEAVYNGVVSKITPDAVYFTENVLDPTGRVTTREVVKRLGSAPGEGR